MKSFFRLTGPYIIVFFLTGIGWGVWLHRSQEKALAAASPIKVLCAEDWLSESVLYSFSRANNVPVQLWTYKNPSELLRQIANTNGQIDVICTSSLLLKSLIQNHWIKKTDFSGLDNLQQVSVDFRHPSYDPKNDYSVPLFWNIYGFFGRHQNQLKVSTWKQTWNTKKITLWGEELGILNALYRLGIDPKTEIEQDQSKTLSQDIDRFVRQAQHVLKTDAQNLGPESITESSDWTYLPLSRVAQLLSKDTKFTFWLPEDGATIEIATLTIGEKSEQVTLAKALINDLLSLDHAKDVYRRVGAGVIYDSISATDIPPMHQAGAIRSFPLNKLLFPQIDIESLPRFQKIYDQLLGSSLNRK